jgi:predicted AAA+ superfamily ATPase
MWIERQLEPHLKRCAGQWPVVMLTGARQTGKSSLLRRAFPNHAYVTLDLPSETEQAEKDGQAFLRRHEGPLLVDEVQYAPGLFRHLKVLVDQHRERKGWFILTGSQKFELMRGLSESLAGRIHVAELEPLSLAEMRSATNLEVAELLVRGGFPELHVSPEIPANEFYRNYAATYLERDVRSLINVGNLRDFERLLRACAARSAQILNKSDLGRDVGVSAITVNHWLSALQASNQVFLLEPWFVNTNKTLTKSPKLFLADTGLMCHLLGIRSGQALLESPFLGAVWETFIFAELRKIQTARHGHWTLHYFREREKEVDFLLADGRHIQLFEAKWTEHPDGTDTQTMEWVRQAFKGRFDFSQQVICNAPNRYPIGSSAAALPVGEISQVLAG